MNRYFRDQHIQSESPRWRGERLFRGTMAKKLFKLDEKH